MMNTVSHDAAHTIIENQLNHIKRRLRIACTSMQSDQNLLCLCEGDLDPWLPSLPCKD